MKKCYHKWEFEIVMIAVFVIVCIPFVIMELLA